MTGHLPAPLRDTESFFFWVRNADVTLHTTFAPQSTNVDSSPGWRARISDMWPPPTGYVLLHDSTHRGYVLLHDSTHRGIIIWSHHTTSLVETFACREYTTTIIQPLIFSLARPCILLHCGLVAVADIVRKWRGRLSFRTFRLNFAFSSLNWPCARLLAHFCETDLCYRPCQSFQRAFSNLS